MSEGLKITLTWFIIVIISIIVSCCILRSCHQVIDEAGGIREIIIQQGKTVKSVYKDISDDNYTKKER